MYQSLKQKLDALHITLVAVSKLQPVAAIQKLYDLGQRDFGENYVQELLSKKDQLPQDIRWHLIGHLQTNKVKQLVGHVQLIQGIDSLKLLKEIDRQASKKGIIQDCLLQVHIAREETKFGFSEEELREAWTELKGGEWPHAGLGHARIRGFMGMASLDSREEEIEAEFENLHLLFKEASEQGQEGFDILSMGMSADHESAIRKGSTMVRIGSLLFGARR